MNTLLVLLLAALWCLAAVLLLAGTTWLVVAAFQVSLWWGLGCALIPPVLVPFMMLYWKRAKIPTMISAAGLFLGAGVFWLMVQTGMLDLEELGRAWQVLKGQL